MATAAQAIDTDSIRRAVELADLNALRIALYQNSGDEEIAALPAAAQMSEGQKSLLKERAVGWLADNAGAVDLPEPPEEELRRLMTMLSGEMTDVEFEARRDLPAFRAVPCAVEWQGEKPEIPEGFRIVIIGSGPAGIAAGVQCELLGLPYLLLDRQPEAGGTWTINRYPDVRVDTPSITYEYSFEKLYPWGEHFNRGEDVRAYLQHVSRKYGVMANSRFGHDVKGAVFDERRNVWRLDVETPGGRQEIVANVLITACGTFANAQLPDIEGAHDFGGQIIHPSAWPEGLDLTGKRVAIIGNGSTGVQLLSAVAQKAGHVSVVQRTPQWISPREKYGAPIEPELAWLNENMPGYWNWSRYTATMPLFDIDRLQRVDREWQAQGGKVSKANDEMRAFLTNYIRQETGGREDLIEKLIPDYAPMSRRPVVDNGWYRALTRDNVELLTGSVERFTKTGFVMADGTERDFDVVIAATGFDVLKYLWPARYKGLEGKDLHETWDAGDGPRAYLSMMVPQFPNLFMLYGPNSQPLTGGTGLPQWWLIWASYAAQCVMRMLKEDKRRVDVKAEAFERYNCELDAEAQGWLQMTPEGGIEKNYYVNREHRRLQVNAPWLSPDYHRMCTVVNWDDLELS
ncbi:flavin-containing monooxygenase [Sphingobium chungangianum]